MSNSIEHIDSTLSEIKEAAEYLFEINRQFKSCVGKAEKAACIARIEKQYDKLTAMQNRNAFSIELKKQRALEAAKDIIINGGV